jgi:hypothetical protein
MHTTSMQLAKMKRAYAILDILNFTDYSSPLNEKPFDLIHSCAFRRKIGLDSSTAECLASMDRPRALRSPQTEH